MIHKFISTTITALALSVFSHAELQGMQDYKPAEIVNSGWEAFVSVGGGNSLIARDGTIFMDMRIGVEWNHFIGAGLYASFILDDIKNPNIKQFKQMIDYNAFGAFAEIIPYNNGFFSVSVPVGVGFGTVNAIFEGDEELEESDRFFVADAAVHFNFRLTHLLEVSIGGGYRAFAGIEENNLDNIDFCSPFGVLQISFKGAGKKK